MTSIRWPRSASSSTKVVMTAPVGARSGARCGVKTMIFMLVATASQGGAEHQAIGILEDVGGALPGVCPRPLDACLRQTFALGVILQELDHHLGPLVTVV